MLPEFSDLARIVVITLLFTLGWAVTAGIVYWDASKRGFALIKIHAWTAAATLAPFIGFAVYVVLRLLVLIYSLVSRIFINKPVWTTQPKVNQRNWTPLPTLVASDLSLETLVNPAVHKEQPRGKRNKWTFTICSGPELGRDFTIESLPVVVGRGSHAEISLINDLGVSREHAEIMEKDGALYIQDLNSTHGTHVNGKRIEGISISSRDRIQVGVTVLQINMISE